jgi:hypothetical protein
MHPYFRWFLLVLILIGASTNLVADLNFKSLGKDDYLESPNHKLRAICEFPSDDENSLYLTTKTDKQRIWKFVRSIGVFWTPDSKYLIVNDYLLRDMNAILVFKIDEGKARLIYQTPYSNSILDKFYPLAFDTNHAVLTINCVQPSGAVLYTKNVSLSGLPGISQSVYPESFIKGK